MRETDVVVVGAGLAGLCAARAVLAAGRDAVVVEARDRVGGRLLNHELAAHPGKVVEIGGQWAGPTQTALLDLARELGVDTYPTYNEGENVLEWRGGLKRYKGAIPRINPAILADTLQAQKRLERLAKTVPTGAPWTAPRARELDSMTFQTWLNRACATKGARTLLELGCQAVWAAEPADVSLLHVLFYINSAGSFDDLVGTEGGAQDRRFVGGSQRVALRLAEELPEGALVLGAPVRRIEHGDDGVVVHADGDVRVRARRAIVALPPALTNRIIYAPPVPGYRDQLTQRTPQGTVWKCMAVYDRPFWRDQGLTGQATSDRGPVRVTFDNSPPDGTPGVLLGFLEGDFARRAGRQDAGQRRAEVVDCFARFFGEAAHTPTEYVEQSWAEEEFTRGCYGCGMTTGAWTSFGEALRAPIGPISWAGAEVATTWSGYMDGAIRSGREAAAEALAALQASSGPGSTVTAGLGRRSSAS
ncbi:MAG: flavin monoamine oxidase family protein [Solirubrobacterales bacterium]|nr:flavin monoamine oxidase family protein [Solirubrobacterales bacterium]